MKRIIYIMALALGVLTLLRIGLQIANMWSGRWADWPSRVYPTIYAMLILELTLLVFMVFIVRTSRIEILVKTAAIFALSVMGLIMEVVFSLVPLGYIPLLYNSEKIIAEMGMDEAKFAALSPCEQVYTYVEVASVSVNHFHQINLAPYWMQENLKGLPKDSVAVCMADELRKNTALVASSKSFNEEAVRKIYVLTFEAYRLSALDQPEFHSALKEAACTTNADPFGDLAVYYYSTVIPGPYPEFEGYSVKEIADIVRPKICGK